MFKKEKVNGYFGGLVEKVKSPKKKRNKLIAYLLIAFIVIGLIVGIALLFVNKLKGNVDPLDENNLKYEIPLYRSVGGICVQQSIECNMIQERILVTDKDAVIKGISLDSKYVLIYDNGMILYTVDTKEREMIEIDSSFEYYKIINNDTKVLGILYGNGLIKDSYYTNTSYYDLVTKAAYFVNLYNDIVYINDNYMMGISIGNNSSYLLSLDSMSEVINTNNICSGFEVKSFNDRNYYIVKNMCNKDVLYDIYLDNKNKIGSSLKNNEFSIDLYGYYYRLSNNKVSKYNIDGKFAVSSVENPNIRQVILNYQVIIEDSKIYLVDVNSGSKFTVGDFVNGNIYYNESDYFPVNYLGFNQGRNAGIYILVGTDKNSINGKMYYFDPISKVSKVFNIGDVRVALEPLK